LNQQINLYQPIFRRQKKVFSAVAMLQICALFLVVFAGIYFYGQTKLQPLRDQLQKLNTDIVQVNAQMTRLENQQAVESGSKLLENEIARLSIELTKRKEIQELLSSRSLGNTAGLSDYLEAFARQHVQGLWLTRITVANGGKNLALEGKTQSSELVPAYLGKLAGESVLNGMSINVMELNRPLEPAASLEFRISTN
jgi:Tfp pilus assembly protein PilN